MKAIWNGKVIAESDDTVLVEGNHYFPISDLDKSLIEKSDTHTLCSWKGEASYFHLNVEGQLNEDAAWYYPAPKDAAVQVKDRIAFWKGVEIKS